MGPAPGAAAYPGRTACLVLAGPGGPPRGLGVVAGRVSGGLEVIDVDDPPTVDVWRGLVHRSAPGLLDLLVQVATPRPGLHVYYRCPTASAAQKLACAVEYDQATGAPHTRILIETRGEGSYCVAPPSPPACHPTGRPYLLASAADLTRVPTVSPREREVLLAAARALDRRPTRPPAPPASSRRRPALGHRPGDDFDRRADWQDVLRPHGWRWVRRGADGEDHWARPGKFGGSSATTNYDGSGLLFVFSTSAAPFEPSRPYTKFAAWALLNHRGDFAAAARDLRARGYGALSAELARLAAPGRGREPYRRLADLVAGAAGSSRQLAAPLNQLTEVGSPSRAACLLWAARGTIGVMTKSPDDSPE